MARNRADHRRLNVRTAFATAVGGMSRAWSGAWGVLVLLSILIAAPAFAPLAGAAFWAHAGLLALAGLMAWGALTRIALSAGADEAGRRGLGAGGLQFGRAEIRIVAALLANLVFVAVVASVMLLAVVMLGVATGLDLGSIQAAPVRATDGRLWIVAGAAAAALLMLGLVLMRLSLFAPASVGRGRIVAMNSMGVAHGAFWPLLLLWGVIAATAAVIPAAMAQGWIAPSAARLIAAVVLPWLWAPLAVGATAAAYRQLEYWTPGEGAR